jgi:indole-3-glycerol phosphate synthase
MAEDILEKIAAHARVRVDNYKQAVSLAQMKELAQEVLNREGDGEGKVAPTARGAFPFLSALRAPEMSFICEVKKASPSKGIIAEDFPYLDIAKQYDAAGAAAISCLTEPKWFLGADDYLKQIAAEVSCPVLRKDFIVDEYMIHQAKVLGASAVLLIVSLLDDTTIAKYLELAHSLGLSTLVETHDESEVARALASGAQIIGVNNRSLRDFSVDLSTAARMRELIPTDCVFVAESGVKNSDDVAYFASAGADAALIGEALMRSGNIAATLAGFKAAAKEARIAGVK